MKIIAFNGSPRGDKSVTNMMVEEFLSGARKAGAQTENILLSTKKIHHCVGCFSCWTKTPGICAIKDDMQELIDKMMSSDIVIFASPVYYGGVTGIMKNFIDRLLPTGDPHFKKDENGVTRHVGRYEKYPDMVIISNCGFPDMECFKYFRSVFIFMEAGHKMKLLAEIYRSASPVLKSKNPDMAGVVKNYLSLLRKAGSELVSCGKLSEETISELEKPLIVPDDFIEYGNKHWDEMLAKTCKD